MKFLSIDDIKNASNIILITDSNCEEKLKIKEFYNGETIILFLENTKLSKQLKNYEKNKEIKIRKFTWNIFKQKHHYRYIAAIESNNYLEPFLLQQSNYNKKIIRFINNLYKDNRIENAYRKNLIQFLKGKLDVNNVFKKINELNPKINFLNKNNFEVDKFNLIVNSFTVSNIYQKIKNLIIFILYPLYSIFYLKSSVNKSSDGSLALRVFRGGFDFFNSDYNLDWIKNNRSLTKKNILLVIEDSIDKKFINDIKKKGYDFTFASKRKPVGKLKIKVLLKNIKLFISSLVYFYYFFKAPLVFQKILLNAWTNYFVWSNFLSSFRPKVFLSYHDYLDNHIYRNILLNKIQCKCIMYKHTSSERVFDIKENYLNVNYAYDCHDLEIHWTQESIEMSKLNKSKSKSFLLSSPLWASEEFLLQNETIENLLKEKNQNNKKIISIFSSPIGSENSFNSIENHFYFLKFIQDLLRERNDIIIAFKPKYKIEDLNDYFSLKKIVEDLKKNKMFKIIKNVTSKNLISASDLTVSMAFTSPSLEAISSGKKGFWVDANNNFPNSTYNNIDNLVARSAKEALNKIEYWLMLNNQEFKFFLNDKVKNKIPLNFNNEAIDKVRSVVLSKINDTRA